jgi:uncharacterized protein (TIGR00369 family)
MSGDGLPDLEVMNAAFRDFVPHNKELGLTIVAAEVTPASVTLELPWDERLVGNPDPGVFHGGAITTLMDAACGASVYVFLKATTPIATLDLRVDFLGRPPARRAVRCLAECIHATRSVAFVRARAYVDDLTKPFALASATFALGTQGRVLSEQDFVKP